MKGALAEEEGSTALTTQRRELDYLLQILGVAGFAVAQPILDVMGKSPETFIFREAGPLGIVLFGVTVAIVPALALWALGAITALAGPRIRRGVHLTTLGLLASAIALQILKRFSPLEGVSAIFPALAVGGLVLWGIARTRPLETYVRWTAAATVAFLLGFLLLSPVSKLVLPEPAGAAAARVRPVPVLMLLFDAFPLASLLDRRGRINADLYPNIAELAGTSTWYRNYTSMDAVTSFSVPTILTGTRVTDRSKEPLAADYPDNLFSLLSETHRLEVFEPVTALCPGTCSRDEETSYAGFGGLLSDALLVWTDLTLPTRTPRDITAQFVEEAEGSVEESDRSRQARRPDDELLGDITSGGDPALHYFHFMMPHAPWDRYASGRAYEVLDGSADLPLAGTGNPSRLRWVRRPSAVRFARQRHIIYVQYTDRVIGRIMNRLRDIGMFEETLVIVTSDHGVSFRPGSTRRGTTEGQMHEMFWVPLFIKAPHQREGVVDDRNLLSVDLLPTIADLLGAEVPWRVDGRSALDPGFDRGPIKEIQTSGTGPDATPSLPMDTAHRRMRREAFVPAGRCRPRRLCPHMVGVETSLIGARLENLTVGSSSDLTATLTLPTDLDARRAAPLPGLVAGLVIGAPMRRDLVVVVAMNGSVAGASETWVQEGTPGRFGVLVPERMLQWGPNELRLFELDGSVLRPIALDA